MQMNMELPGSPHVYTLQLNRRTTPIEVVDELCHAVWKGLLQETTGLEPRRWLKLHSTFFDIFKKRLAAYKGCGAECLDLQRPALYQHQYRHAPGDPATTAVYVLETRQDAEGFVRSLSNTALRVYRGYVGVGRDRRQNISDRIFLAVRNTMVKYFFECERCLNCKRRSQPAEPNIWRDFQWTV